MASFKIRTCANVAALLAIGAAAGVGLNRALPAQPEGEMDHEAMMAEMMKLGQPGEHHKRLDRMTGEWAADAKFMMPDGSSMESGGSMSSKWILGGRFVKGDFHLNDMMGQPFDGISIVGYDNATGEYKSVWIDSFSTAVFVHDAWFEGDTFVSQGKNGHGGEMMIKATPKGENVVVDEFFEKGPDGEWMPSGTITYTRK